MNVVFTLGNGVGSVVGGGIADQWGWRAAFYSQLPILVVAGTLSVWKVYVPLDEKVSAETWQEKVKRVDWTGSALVVAAVSSSRRSLRSC